MTKTPEQINQYIHEARGLCWHEPIESPTEYTHAGVKIICAKCSIARYPLWGKCPNYLEYGKAWGELLNWAKDKDWWCDFFFEKAFNGGADIYADPTALATEIVKYLEGYDEERD